MINFDNVKDFLVFEAYRGSFAYGTYIEGVSDKDKVGIYVQPIEQVAGINTYVPQIQDAKGDCVYYEIKRFLELLVVSNPTMLETLFFDQECIIYKHPVFDYVLVNRDKFITKLCKNSFYGYAKQQISKARGLNKKQNWEKEKITRKEILDFCYVIEAYSSYPLSKLIETGNYDQKFFGVTNVPHARDIYALFYDWDAHSCFSELVPESLRIANKSRLKSLGLPMGFGYKGIVKSGEGKSVAESNSLRLSSIPNGEKCIGIFVYNKDAYTSSCKDFKEYQEWVKNRNMTRWTDVKEHGQQIDGKNLMHCKRLIDMSLEIAEGKGVITRRPDAAELLKIRRGEISLEKLLTDSESKMEKMDELFEKSNLPETVDVNMVNSLLNLIRREFENERNRNS